MDSPPMRPRFLPLLGGLLSDSALKEEEVVLGPTNVSRPRGGMMDVPVCPGIPACRASFRVPASRAWRVFPNLCMQSELQGYVSSGTLNSGANLESDLPSPDLFRGKTSLFGALVYLLHARIFALIPHFLHDSQLRLRESRSFRESSETSGSM